MTEKQVLTYVTFGVAGDDFDPTTITHKLKVKPTRYHRKGDIIKNNPYGKKRDYSKWSLKSELDPTENLQTHLEELLTILLPHSEEIVDLSSKYEVRFFCSIFSGEDKVQIRINPKIIKNIYILKSDIVINFYYNS